MRSRKIAPNVTVRLEPSFDDGKILRMQHVAAQQAPSRLLKRAVQKHLNKYVQQWGTYRLLWHRPHLRDRDLAGAVQHRQKCAARTVQFAGRPRIGYADLGQHLNHTARQADDAAVLRELHTPRDPLSEAAANLVESKDALGLRLSQPRVTIRQAERNAVVSASTTGMISCSSTVMVTTRRSSS